MYTKDWLKYSLSVLIVFVLGAITCGILFAPMLVGMYGCCLKKLKGEDFEYGELFDGVKKQFLPSFLLGLALMVVSIVLNLIPCVGWLLSFAFQILAMPVLVYSLFKLSYEAETYKVEKLKDLVMGIYEKLKPQYFMFVLWLFLAGIIGAAGGIVCGIGALFTYPIIVLALAVSYSDVFGTALSAQVEAEPVAEPEPEVEPESE